MKLRHFPYYFFIILFSCKEPTLIGDKDCAGVIGGKAVVDDCGYCTGGTTTLQFNAFLGCDTACIGSQFDCNNVCTGEHIVGCDSVCTHQNNAKMYDLCGDCIQIGAPEWNEDCKGCTNPNATCNSFDSTATVYEEGSCISPSYICEAGNDGLLDITTMKALTTDNGDCYESADENSCGPGENICKLFDCNDPGLGLDTTQSIPCNPELALAGYFAFESDIGNDTCDYFGIIEDVVYNFTSCPEFGYDGGDCKQVDCRGVHFSDDLCSVILEPDTTWGDPIQIDTSTDIPDTTIETTIITTKITGCYLGEYSDSIRTEILYKFGSGMPDSILIATDSIIVVGTTGWLGDGQCDRDDLFKDYGLDFNCVKFDFEGGDCYSLGRLDTHVRKKTISNKLYQVDKENKLELPKLNMQ